MKLLETSSCSGTKRLDEAEIEKMALRHPAKESVPTKKVNLKGDMVSGLSLWQVVVIVIGVLFIVAVVIFIVKRIRKK